MWKPKGLALGFLTGASLLILGIFFFELPGRSWLFAVLVMGFPVALVTVAVARQGQLGRLRTPLAILLAMLQAGVLGVLLFSGSGKTGLYGLPLSLHFLLLLIWLGPLCVTTTVYAVMFSELGVDDALLEQVEQLRLARRDESEPA